MSQQPYKTCRNCGQNAVMTILVCRRCGRSLQDAILHNAMPITTVPRASGVSTASPTTQSLPPGCQRALLVLLVCVLLGGLIDTIKGGHGDEHEAWAMAKQFVTERLKSPSSANFPYYDQDFVAKIDEHQFQVNAWVESQNSFGAQLRSPFRCTLTSKGGHKWICEELTIYDP